MQVTHNKTTHLIDDLIRVAKRENNSKREYLLVNTAQAKHLPTSPGRALGVFRDLAGDVARAYSGERIAVIGFAETATAIGAAVAECLNGAYYLHTTRENIVSAPLIASFSEEHSHAVHQKLYCSDVSELRLADRIIFVEDELTTGKTILNFIASLREGGIISAGQRFSTASLINAMSDERLNEFARLGIDCHHLIRATYYHDRNRFSDNVFSASPGHEPPGPLTDCLEIGGMLNPRIGVSAAGYSTACLRFATGILALLGDRLIRSGSTLVLGTEEFMFPAVVLGAEIERQGISPEVFVHATTRSPIMACCDERYPINNRHRLASLYGVDRDTFVYNLRRYDNAIIVTDAESDSSAGCAALAGALACHGCGNIFAVRWTT